MANEDLSDFEDVPIEVTEELERMGLTPEEIRSVLVDDEDDPLSFLLRLMPSMPCHFQGGSGVCELQMHAWVRSGKAR